MAGGMTPGRGVPIGERPVSTGEDRSSTSSGAPSPLEVVAPKHPHVWVRDESGAECPGVIVELAQREGTWLALVVMVTSPAPGVRITQQGMGASITLPPGGVALSAQRRWVQECRIGRAGRAGVRRESRRPRTAPPVAVFGL